MNITNGVSSAACNMRKHGFYLLSADEPDTPIFHESEVQAYLIKGTNWQLIQRCDGMFHSIE
jgi:hypothetical protein